MKSKEKISWIHGYVPLTRVSRYQTKLQYVHLIFLYICTPLLIILHHNLLSEIFIKYIAKR